MTEPSERIARWLADWPTQQQGVAHTDALSILVIPRLCIGEAMAVAFTADVTLTARFTSDETLERAFAWLCRQRRRWPDAADVWSLRRDWAVEKARLQPELRSRWAPAS